MKVGFFRWIALVVSCSTGSAAAAFDFGLGSPVERVANAKLQMNLPQTRDVRIVRP